MDEQPRLANAPADIRVRHATRYAFNDGVTFGPHRLMLRPRDSFDLRIVRTGLAIDPPAALSWMHDVYGNSIAIASFSRPGRILSIDSELVVKRYASTSPRGAAGPWSGGAPVAYGDADRFVLAPFIAPAEADPEGKLGDFAEWAVDARNGRLGHPLLDLSQAVHDALAYSVRFEEGTQAPLLTLRSGRGSCRDYAWLFVECARRLGYAARFVSGYLHNIAEGFDAAAPLAASVGYSHAWAEVYVPGDGWIEFDPTNALVADRHLIRIAVTRTPAEASPVSGSFSGGTGGAPPEVSVVIEPVAAQEPW